jgi:hypothetical protein
MWLAKVTASSFTFAIPASDMTWKPPLSVRMGLVQPMNLCRPPSRSIRSGPGAQHQMVGVA